MDDRDARLRRFIRDLIANYEAGFAEGTLLLQLKKCIATDNKE